MGNTFSTDKSTTGVVGLFLNYNKTKAGYQTIKNPKQIVMFGSLHKNYQSIKNVDH